MYMRFHNRHNQSLLEIHIYNYIKYSEITMLDVFSFGKNALKTTIFLKLIHLNILFLCHIK